MCFLLCLVSVLFTGPPVLVVDLYRKFLPLVYMYTHTMLYQRTTGECLIPKLFSQISHATLSRTSNVSNSTAVFQYAIHPYTTCIFHIAMGRDPTQSTFVYSNYLYVNDLSKCMSGMFMRSHAMSYKVMQCHAMSCKVMQCHAKSCKVSFQVESHTYSVNFILLS